jgi:hypothetical protein
MRKPFEFAIWRTSIASLVIAGGLLTLSAPAAHAQFLNFIFGGGGLQPEDVESMLQDRGLELIGPLHRNGAVYVADVEGSRGGPLRLIIDAHDGRIVQRYRIGPPRYDADLRAPRPPGAIGEQPLEQQQGPMASSAIGAPPAVITFGESMARGDDATAPNVITVPRAMGDDPAKSKPKPQPQAKHKKIELTPLAQPASTTPSANPPAAAAKPPVHAEAASATDAKIAPVAPVAAPSPQPAAAPNVAPAPPKPKPAINDVPVNPLD